MDFLFKKLLIKISQKPTMYTRLIWNRHGARILNVLLVCSLATAAATVLAATEIAVSQKGQVFRPGTLVINRGDVVHFDNDDNVLHHVYVETPRFNFDSGGQPPGKRVSIRFTERGTFPVQCEIHPKMRLDVEVR